MENQFKGKNILITGGTGTIGSELVRQILKYNPRQLRALSRNETRQYHLLEELGHPSNVRMLIGDVRDKDRLNMALRDIDIVFHTAALKHVPFCEYNPYEAVKTNILGSQNVIDAALHNGVKRVIGISTDKAANPFNILGVSKLMMEKLFTNSHYFSDSLIRLSCVRFGNVSWSQGSVLPLWKKQAETVGTINVTDKDMTRFLMSTKQAVNLTLKAANLSQGGEIFILKMPSIKLNDLAKIFIDKYYPGKKIKIKEIGNRGGEKMHEHLLGQNDWSREIWSNKEMLILSPATNIYNLKNPTTGYKGFKRLSKNEEYSSDQYININKVRSII